MKIQDDRIGKKVRYTKHGQEFVGIIRDIRRDDEDSPEIASIEIKGWGYHTLPCTQILGEA